MRTLAAFLLIVLLAVPVHAAVIGVNRGVVRYEDVLRGGYAEQTVAVSTDASEPVPIELEPYGEVADWLRFEPAEQERLTSRDDPLRLRIIVEPPPDVANGVYTGNVRVLTGTLIRSGDREGRMGSNIRAALNIRLSVEVTGQQRTACRARGFRIIGAEEGEALDLIFEVENTGNVRIQPEVSITALDQFRERRIAEYSLLTPQQLLPTTTSRFQEPLIHDLAPGQYWATFSAPPCSGSETITFDVVERGGYADQGVFERLSATSYGETGDILPIEGDFRNIGQRVVTAKMRGSITHQDGTVEKVIDTDQFRIEPGATARFETFFNPQRAGQYTILAHILYNGKVTHERSYILNINGRSFATGQAVSFGSLRHWSTQSVIVVALGLLALVLVRRRRRGW